jgi:hypothetical protein
MAAARANHEKKIWQRKWFTDAEPPSTSWDFMAVCTVQVCSSGLYYRLDMKEGAAVTPAKVGVFAAVSL